MRVELSIAVALGLVLAGCASTGPNAHVEQAGRDYTPTRPSDRALFARYGSPTIVEEFAGDRHRVYIPPADEAWEYEQKTLYFASDKRKVTVTFRDATHAEHESRLTKSDLIWMRARAALGYEIPDLPVMPSDESLFVQHGIPSVIEEQGGDITRFYTPPTGEDSGYGKKVLYYFDRYEKLLLREIGGECVKEWSALSPSDLLRLSKYQELGFDIPDLPIDRVSR